MFEKYIASKQDFKAIEEGIKVVWLPAMNFVFKKKSLIKNVLPVSFDSRFFYIWSPFKVNSSQSMACKFDEYQMHKVPHNLKITESNQVGWCANANKWKSYLPKALAKNSKFILISGGLMAPFTKIQQECVSEKYSNPYTTYESYLATIVHEFAHIYYNQHRLWWYSDEKENITYLETALKLFRNQEISLNRIKIKIPIPQLWSEVFAFCSEYWASRLFWPKHTKNLDQMNLKLIEKALIKEGKKNLDRQNSIFCDQDSSHLAAAVFGKIILQKYPNSWPQVLLKPQKL